MPPKKAAAKQASQEEIKIKKPVTSFFHFINDRRNKFKEDNPDMSMCQITKALSEVWKGLTDDERKKYEDLTTADRDRYNKELKEQGIPASKSSKKAAAVDGAPKKPLTAYFLFLAVKRSVVKMEFPELSMCD